MIDTPGHGTLPSGHATEAFAIAATLDHLVPVEARATDLQGQLMAMAARIAVNRTVAGVHFPIDSFAGAILGFAVADVIAARAGQLDRAQAVQFSGNGIGPEDFFTARVWQAGTRHSFSTPDGIGITEFEQAGPTTDVSTILDRVWQEARAEWSL
jgi:hypothetical protein